MDEKEQNLSKEYYELRQKILNVVRNPVQIDPAQADVLSAYGLLMELGLPEGTVTLMCLIDGTVSLYYEIGGGVIGGGKNERVKSAASRMIQIADKMKANFAPTKEFPLPHEGEARFYLLTAKGVLAAEMVQESMDEGHPLFALALAGNEVLTELRMVDQVS